MRDLKKHILQDLFIVAISIGFAIYIGQSGLAEKFVELFDGYKYIGAFISGLFFTSVFTAAPSITLIGSFAHNMSLLSVTIFGGLGALCGDYIIFRFVKDRVSKDLEVLFKTKPGMRISTIFKRQLFRFLAPFIGALIIASPLPDEIGILMLGLSKVSSRKFAVISFVLNSLGILLVAWLAINII